MPKTNTYEMMFILRPDLNQEQINKQMHKYKDLLKNEGAEKISMEVWGKRRLAYPIKNFNDGIYILTYYNASGSQVAPVERDMRLSEEVIRYLTIKHDKNLEFEEKEIPSAESIPISSPQPYPVLAEDLPHREIIKAESTEEVIETESSSDSAEAETETPSEIEENVAQTLEEENVEPQEDDETEEAVETDKQVKSEE
jgi:small subunit ribosomal protein S6